MEDNDAGLYVREASADLAQKLAWLRAHPEEVARMGRNGRALAEREFDRDMLAGARAGRARGGGALTALSYCVVNTNGRDWLLACLDAIERTHPPGVSYEVLVLDNASEDGSAAGRARRLPGGAPDRARTARAARPRTTRACCARRAATFCLLLNEDTELREGATRALLDALEGDPRAARRRRAAADQRRRADGLRVAPAQRRLGAGGRAVHARQLRGAEPRQTRCAGWAGCSRAR